jgi:hypothetical protein
MVSWFIRLFVCLFVDAFIRLFDCFTLDLKQSNKRINVSTNKPIDEETKLMRAHITFLTIALLGAYALGCQNQPPESRAEKIAAAYCSCTERLASLNEQAAALQHDTSRQAEFAQLLEKMDAEFRGAKDCSATSVIATYGKIGADELREVDAHLTAKCPAMASHRDLLRELLGE